MIRARLSEQSVIITVNIIFIMVPAVSFCHLQYSKQQLKSEVTDQKKKSKHIITKLVENSWVSIMQII